MREKERNNLFRFSLYQEKVLLCEKSFSADMYNPFTRYSIDIRNILPKIIVNFQKILSKREYKTSFSVGRKNIKDDTSRVYYDSYNDYLKFIENSPKRISNHLEYNPKIYKQEIDGRVIKGVECKIGLYINDKTIVERTFYVNEFNPISRWSVEILNKFSEVMDVLTDKIKNDDITNMWDDYDLINIKRFSISQIREFSPYKRAEILKSIQNYKNK